ncbi:MAG: LPP20 family lipoprotein [Treponema sp.]|nr:LPP20 family lipoprotein [Treponema sp.]
MKIKTTAFLYHMKGFCLLLAFSACMTVNAQNKGGSNTSAPDWIRDPYKKFDQKTHVAAVGIGNSRQVAEKDALGKLVAIFGQSIQVDEKISTSYREAVKSGAAASWSENTAIDNSIATSAGMDSLVGAEIGETWYDGKTNHYAAAVLNKTKALQVYPNMIKANQAMIDSLVNMPAADKNSLDGFARYQFAAMIADVTFSYGNLLSHIGAPSFAQGLKKGDDYRIEAQNITKTIPVGITVKNDKSGRIQGAFAKAFSDLGFRSGGTDSRYVLTVDINISPVELANQTNKFSRIEVTANLSDTRLNAVLFPFNLNSREGHTTQSEADNRAYAAAERKINEDYKEFLNDYLTQLVPKKK